MFIHGLGGTSRFTWSHDKDLSLFWPQVWLPFEPGFGDIRISTFGYNAYYRSQDKDILNISDFAKDLLMKMKFAVNEQVKPLNIGLVSMSALWG